jgi:hypothetical protein
MNPWHTDPPEIQRDEEAQRRYQRSLRLSQFQRELAAWERHGLIDNPRYTKRVAYRQMCLDNWSAYLDGAIDPPEGRKTKRG